MQASMARRRRIHIIEPNGVYFDSDIREIFRVATVGREVRMHGLRCAKRGGRRIYLGEWLLEWIRNAEVGPR